MGRTLTQHRMSVKYLVLFVAVFTQFTPGPCLARDGFDIVNRTFHQLRGKASVSTVDMTIHRPAWQRTVAMQAWTRGEKESLIRITAPAKDQGNATLKQGRDMWIYNPKVNRIIKLQPSMMAQAWMGSDFSNNDLAKSDTVLYDYDHQVESVSEEEGHQVFTVVSIPKPEAPVVWGMLKLRIRDDDVLLAEEFYDEDMELVKAMTCTDIRPVDNLLFPFQWKMAKAGAIEEFTLLQYREIEFKETLPSSIFSKSSLRK